MDVELTNTPPLDAAASVLALPLAAEGPSGAAAELDTVLHGVVSRLVAEAKAEEGTATVLHGMPSGQVAAARVVLCGVGVAGAVDADVIRTAVAAGVRATSRSGGVLAWPVEASLPVDADLQARAAVEGAILGAYEPARWKTGERLPAFEGCLLCAADESLRPVVSRAEVVARWTNRARELVDMPANELTPARLAEATRALLADLPAEVEVHEPDAIHDLGMGGLAAVAAGSANEPRLIVLRYGSARAAERLGLVGKAITFDSGGFFLKPQSDIVRQKADMGGGAAVICAVGAIAELGLAVDLVAVVPAAENLLGGSAFRPGDVIATAAGLTVEVTNPDAEGRLILADGLWYARREGAARLVDVATLTGGVRAGMGDVYGGVFANDGEWRDRVVGAGNASGDHAWPWPLHRRYRGPLESSIADLRNTSGRSFGYPVFAATFLERFAGDVPWAHVDMYSTAYLDDERDYFRAGATGYGVRLLVELVSG